MLYLLLAIACSAAFAMILKWNVTRATSMAYVLFGTYLSATLIAGSSLLLAVPSVQNLEQPSQWVWLLGLSALTGIIHFAAFKLYQKSIEVNGIAITGAFAKMGILIPTIVSLFVWHEYPSLLQSAGILLTLAALFYYYAPQKNAVKALHVSYLLLALMIVNGSTDFMTKVFQKNFDLSQMNSFLTLTFFVGLIISLFFALRQGKMDLRDILMGSVLGIPIVFSFYFLIMALDFIIATIVFPVFSAGSLVAITLSSILFFKEMPGKKEWITIGGILISLTLINL